MKEQEFRRMLDLVEDSYLEEAETWRPRRRHRRWIAWGIAACLCLMAGLWWSGTLGDLSAPQAAASQEEQYQEEEAARQRAESRQSAEEEERKQAGEQAYQEEEAARKQAESIQAAEAEERKQAGEQAYQEEQAAAAAGQTAPEWISEYQTGEEMTLTPGEWKTLEDGTAGLTCSFQLDGRGKTLILQVYRLADGKWEETSGETKYRIESQQILAGCAFTRGYNQVEGYMAYLDEGGDLIQSTSSTKDMGTLGSWNSQAATAVLDSNDPITIRYGEEIPLMLRGIGEGEELPDIQEGYAHPEQLAELGYGEVYLCTITFSTWDLDDPFSALFP